MPDSLNNFEDAVGKAEFARQLGVSKARVSQWLAERRIHGEALAGSGRKARIRVEIAKAQLRKSLDPDQRTTVNARARLDEPTAEARLLSGEKLKAEANSPQGEANSDPVAPPGMLNSEHTLSVEESIKRARLRQIEVATEKERLRLAERAGELLPAVEVERQWRSILADLRARLLTIPSRVGSRLPHLSAADVGVIGGEIRDALIELGGDHDRA